jgi:hypothetical protein
MQIVIISSLVSHYICSCFSSTLHITDLRYFWWILQFTLSSLNCRGIYAVFISHSFRDWLNISPHPTGNASYCLIFICFCIFKCTLTFCIREAQSNVKWWCLFVDLSTRDPEIYFVLVNMFWRNTILAFQLKLDFSVAGNTPYWSIFTHNTECDTLHKRERTPFILEKTWILNCGH